MGAVHSEVKYQTCSVFSPCPFMCSVAREAPSSSRKWTKTHFHCCAARVLHCGSGAGVYKVSWDCAIKNDSSRCHHWRRHGRVNCRDPTSAIGLELPTDRSLYRIRRAVHGG